MNTREKIMLDKAAARFTRAKAAVDGTAKAEARYQKAKRELDVLRRSLRSDKKPHVRPGDAVAFPEALRATTVNPREGEATDGD